jgi:hypothetical protein
VLGRAVDGAAGGREDDLPDARAPGRLGQVHRAQDVLRDVEQRVGHAHPHVDLRGQVEDHLGSHLGDQPGQRGVQDVQLAERAAGGQRGVEVLPAAAAQVVDRDHLVAAAQQPVDQGRPDEPGAAGDEGTHGAQGSGPGCPAQYRRSVICPVAAFQVM